MNAYFEERLLPGVPEHLRKQLDFEELYHVFGGKLVHIADYVSDFGELTMHPDLISYL